MTAKRGIKNEQLRRNLQRRKDASTRKELKEHPERNRVKTVTMTAEELYEKIMKNGGSYDIEGGILALKMAVDEEKKEKEKKKK